MISFSVTGNRKLIQSFLAAVKVNTRNVSLENFVAPDAYYVSDCAAVLTVNFSINVDFFDVSILRSKHFLHLDIEMIKNGKGQFHKERNSCKVKYHEIKEITNYSCVQLFPDKVITSFEQMKPTSYDIDAEDDESMSDFEEVEQWEERNACYR